MARSRTIMVAAVVLVIVIAGAMAGVLVWQGLDTRSDIDYLNQKREAYVEELEKEWGIDPREEEIPGEVQAVDIYKNVVINGEKAEISAASQAAITRASAKFTVAASIVISVGLALIGLVILLALAFLFSPATLEKTPERE